MRAAGAVGGGGAAGRRPSAEFGGRAGRVEDCAVFLAPVAVNVQVTLHDAEHDRYNRYKWVSPAELLARCRPDVVREGIQRALRALGFMPKPRAAVVLVSDEGVALIKRVN